MAGDSAGAGLAAAVAGLVQVAAADGLRDGALDPGVVLPLGQVTWRWSQSMSNWVRSKPWTIRWGRSGWQVSVKWAL